MGAVLIVVPVCLIALGLNFVNLIRHSSSSRVTGVSILLPLFILVGYGLLGGIDDWAKLRSRGEGISARAKLIGQIGLAAITAIVMSLVGGGFQFANSGFVPVLGTVPLSPFIYIPCVIFLIVATSNAVNLTDGLDGLAGTITASPFAAYGLIALLQGQIFRVQFCFLMVGACFAFLWENALPSHLILGGTGALRVGA